MARGFSHFPRGGEGIEPVLLKKVFDPQTAANIQNILNNAQSVLQQASVAGGPQQLAQPASQPNPAQGAS